MTEDIENEVAAALEQEFGAAVRPPRHAVEGDGRSRRIEMLRDDISRHNAAVIEIARQRDIAVRQRNAEIQEAKRAFDEASSRLEREIAEIEARANRRMAIRAQLRAASRASLAVLEGAKPETAEIET